MNGVNPDVVDKLYAKLARESAADAGLTKGTDSALAYEAGFIAGINAGVQREAEHWRAASINESKPEE